MDETPGAPIKHKRFAVRFGHRSRPVHHSDRVIAAGAPGQRN